MSEPFLIGKFLVLDHDEDGFTLHRFVEKLSDLTYAAVAYSPHDGKPLAGAIIINIKTLAIRVGEDPIFPRAMIFETAEAALEYRLGSDDDDEAEAPTERPQRLHS